MKLLELIGCPFVDYSTMDCNEDALTKLYLKHYYKGKKEGYTPIIMDRDMKLQDWYWQYFNVPMRPENYPLLVQTIIEKANSKPFSYWYHEIYEKYLLDLQDGDDEEYERNLLEEILRNPSDKQYAASTESLGIVPLRIKQYIQSSEWTYEKQCWIDNSDVLALIPATKSWEILAWLPIGGFNWCPTPEYQVAFAKHMSESYGADLMSVSTTQIEFYFEHPLIEKERVIAAAHDLTVMDDDLYQDMEICPAQVYGKQWLPLWWD